MENVFQPVDLSQIDWPNALLKFDCPEEWLSSRLHVTCPICCSPKSYRFTNYKGEGNWICKKCGSGKGPRLLHEALNLGYKEIYLQLKNNFQHGMSSGVRNEHVFHSDELTEAEVVNNRRWLRSAWKISNWIKVNDAGWRYLQSRVPFLDLHRIDQSLRLALKMPFNEYDAKGKKTLIGNFPTLFATVQSASGEMITMHRTYLTNSGCKVPFDNAKMQMGGVRKLKGAGIHLVTCPTSRVLAVGEGLETMLAAAVAHQYQINVRSYLNAGNLAKADILRSQFDKVIIYADHDKFDPKRKYRPGEHYANELARRLMEMGFEVEVRIPSVECSDWADVWSDATNKISNLLDRLVTESVHENSDNPFKIIAGLKKDVLIQI